MAKPRISSIVAIARNNVIGAGNDLLWHIPEDFAWFKTTTLGKPIIMGRKTYESLGKPLPGRLNIVVSRTGKSRTIDDTIWVCDLTEALEYAKIHATNNTIDEIFIIGGGEIYKQSMDKIDRLYLTLIDRTYEGDTYFPEFNWNDWNIISEDKRPGDPPFTFYVLERKK